MISLALSMMFIVIFLCTWKELNETGDKGYFWPMVISGVGAFISILAHGGIL